MISIKVDTKNLILKLQRLKYNLPLEIEGFLKIVGNKMKVDIETLRRVQKMPLYSGGPNAGSKYTLNNPFEIGIIDALESQKVLTQINKSLISLTLGDWEEIEEQTPFRSKVGSYGALLLGKDGRPVGTRAGGSTEYGFDPRHGMIKEKKEKHPGVQPVYVFQDTLQFYKKDILIGLREAIKKAGK